MNTGQESAPSHATPSQVDPIAHARDLVDYAASLDCIHCGLCISSCPTYRLSGRESASPRGRIHLMRAAAEARVEADADFAEEMDYCLVCRNCESVCPAGVQFGRMMELTRDGLESRRQRKLPARLARWLGFRVILPSRMALRLVGSLTRLMQVSGLARVLAPALGAAGRALQSLPALPPARERALLPQRNPADSHSGDSNARPALFMLEGCAQPELFGHVNRSTVKALCAAGHDVHVARAVCCGALHAHNGELDQARRLARLYVQEWVRSCAAQGTELIPITNASGCGAHLREYGELLADDEQCGADAARFSALVRDWSELLSPRIADGSLKLQAPTNVKGPVAWDDPCHLCHGQGVREDPRALLKAIPGLEQVELHDSESCCGSAGIYSLLRPADGAAILAPKLETLAQSGARTLVTANPGCQMQWIGGIRSAGMDVRVVHLAELVQPVART